MKISYKNLNLQGQKDEEEDVSVISVSENEKQNTSCDIPKKSSNSAKLKNFMLSNSKRLLIVPILVLILLIPSGIKLIEDKKKAQVEYELNEERIKLWDEIKSTSIQVRDKHLPDISNLDVMINKPSETLLIGISSPAVNSHIRQLIRMYQFNTYKNYEQITWRFFLPNPPPLYREFLKAENETHGDLIILENVPEGYAAAYTSKVYEFFRYVKQNMTVFKYVARLDTDIYVNIPEFFENVFTQDIQDLNDLVFVAQYVKKGFVWPQGALEVVSWKLMLMISKFYENAPLAVPYEDIAMQLYIEFVQLKYKKIEIDDLLCVNGVEEFWNNKTPNNIIRIHELKNESDYVAAASCFDQNGYNFSKAAKIREYYGSL